MLARKRTHVSSRLVSQQERRRRRRRRRQARQQTLAILRLARRPGKPRDVDHRIYPSDRYDSHITADETRLRHAFVARFGDACERKKARERIFVRRKERGVRSLILSDRGRLLRRAQSAKPADRRDSLVLSFSIARRRACRPVGRAFLSLFGISARLSRVFVALAARTPDPLVCLIIVISPGTLADHLDLASSCEW